MALDFPNSPSDGQIYTDPATGEQWVYEAATNSWTSKGLVNTSGGLVYKGTIDITKAPPAGVSSGWQYSVEADGTANAGFGPGITGTVTKGSIITYTGTGWLDTSYNLPQATAAVAGIDKKLWKRSGTELSPETAGDGIFVNKVRASTGILFGSDTASANALDDYEEGTFDPVVRVDNTSGATIALNAIFNTLRYAKIGKAVFVQGRLTSNDTPASGTAISVTLPFAPVGALPGENYTGGAINRTNNIANITNWGITNTTDLRIFANPNVFTTNQFYEFNFWYYTNS